MFHEFKRAWIYVLCSKLLSDSVEVNDRQRPACHRLAWSVVSTQFNVPHDLS